MIYDYTWGHLKLIAEVCNGEITDENSITDNWITVLENNQKDTFPFTMWPLSYLNSVIITSSFFNSPSSVLVPGSPIRVDFYDTNNEVLIVCFKCECEFGKDMDITDIMPVKLHKHLKKQIMKELSRINKQVREINLNCIIFTGFRSGSVVAMLMSLSIHAALESQSTFLKTDPTNIDCVVFSPSHASVSLNKNLGETLSRYIPVYHSSDYTTPVTKEYSLILSSEVDTKRSIRSLIQSSKPVSDAPLSVYIEAIQRKILLVV